MFIEFPELLASIYVAERLGRHSKPQGEINFAHWEVFKRCVERSKEDAATWGNWDSRCKDRHVVTWPTSGFKTAYIREDETETKTEVIICKCSFFRQTSVIWELMQVMLWGISTIVTTKGMTVQLSRTPTPQWLWCCGQSKIFTVMSWFLFLVRRYVEHNMVTRHKPWSEQFCRPSEIGAPISADTRNWIRKLVIDQGNQLGSNSSRLQLLSGTRVVPRWITEYHDDIMMISCVNNATMKPT